MTMTVRSCGGFAGTARLMALVPALLFGTLAWAGGNIAKIVGADECGECHKKEVEAWRQTRHYKTFNELARTKEAKEISGKLGIKRIKRESDCLTCHFTSKDEGGEADPISGISCESCHGPAKDWLKVHSDYGGQDVKKDQETPAHKAERIAAVTKAGMIRPADLYGVANNCYQCHLVPNEKLVNQGGHKAGSPFELVSWSQGEIRHNYFSSHSGEENLAAPIERQRMMYVLGNALELEHALRAVGKATAKDRYAVTMAKRVQLVLRRLDAINKAVAIPEVKDMIAIGGGVKLKLNNEAELAPAADKVGKLARQFASKHDGSSLAALDALLPKQDKYKGKTPS